MTKEAIVYAYASKATLLGGMGLLSLTLSLTLGLVSAAHAEMGDLSVGGVWVCRLTQGIAGLTLEQRMVEVERRLTEVLSTPKYRQVGVGVSIRPVGRDAAITVGDLTVLTVTAEDAARTTVTPMELARQWAQRLATGLNRALPDSRFFVF